MMDTDQELVLQLKKGSLEALGLIYDRHCQTVYRTALAITGDVDVANDLLQDVFLRLHRFACRIDPERPLDPWLYRMTTNLAYTWIKRNRRWLQPLEDFVDWLAGGDEDSPSQQIEKKDDWEHIQQAISSLPLSQRIVVVLYYLNDCSLQEISEICEVPIGTVKSRLHYGRNTLKKKLGMLQGLVPELSN